MKIAVGSDRRGFEYKEKLKRYLQKQGHEISDTGTYDNKFPADYPVFAQKVGEKITSGECEKGIVICSTGTGVMIACNKIKGIRCGMGYTDEAAGLMREHNDANVIAFGQDQMTFEEVKRRTDIFLTAGFLAGYHCTRTEQLKRLEEGQEICQTPIINPEMRR